jgi:hypothetical protein
MTQVPHVINVVANDDYTLTLTFNNYEIKTFDMLPYIKEKHIVFNELINLNLFKTVVPWEETIQWCHEQDLCRNTLYLESITANRFPQITKVIPNDDYTLTLTFSNGEYRIFDMKHLINEKLIGFEKLINLNLFKTVDLWYGVVFWWNPRELTIRPDMCYLDSVSVNINK